MAILSRAGVTVVSVVERLTAKSKVPGTNPLLAVHCDCVIVSILDLAIPLVLILAKVEFCQLEPFQYFQVVLLSKETRYLMLVLVGVVWVVVMLEIEPQAEVFF